MIFRNDYKIYLNVPFLMEMVTYIFQDGQCDELDMLGSVKSFFEYKQITELTY